MTVTLTEIHNLPLDWDVLLLDKTSRVSVNFRELGKYTFFSSAGETVREFRIVVGRNEFVETNDLDLAGAPQDFVLSQNYPNPFNPSTQISYEIPVASQVKIVIYDLRGQFIWTLIDEQQSAGRYVVSWDGTNAGNERVASGIYLVRMEAGRFDCIRRVILIK